MADHIAGFSGAFSGRDQFHKLEFVEALEIVFDFLVAFSRNNNGRGPSALGNNNRLVGVG